MMMLFLVQWNKTNRKNPKYLYKPYLYTVICIYLFVCKCYFPIYYHPQYLIQINCIIFNIYIPMFIYSYFVNQLYNFQHLYTNAHLYTNTYLSISSTILIVCIRINYFYTYTNYSIVYVHLYIMSVLTMCFYASLFFKKSKLFLDMIILAGC